MLPSRPHGMSCAERFSAHLCSAPLADRAGSATTPSSSSRCRWSATRVSTRGFRGPTPISRQTSGRAGSIRACWAVDTPVRPSPSHTYEFALIGVGKPVSFRVLDPDTRDDYGSFRIYLRNAATGDCAGRGHSAFGLSATACLAATATSPRPPRLPAVPKVVALDQAPVAKVLRSSDVSAVNQEAPSGALTASQFATLDNSSRSAARTEKRLLRVRRVPRGGDQSVRRVGIAEPQVHRGEAELPPAGTSCSPARSHTGCPHPGAGRRDGQHGPRHPLPQGYILTFAATAGGVGGLELLASAGKYLYTLRAVANSGSVSRPAEEPLLGELLAGS